jgi:hypothetical protein
MKAYWGSGGITPRILDIRTRGRWVVSFTPRPLYSRGKSPRYSLGRRGWVGPRADLEAQANRESHHSPFLELIPGRRIALRSLGLWRRGVMWYDTDVSENLAASISGWSLDVICSSSLAVRNGYKIPLRGWRNCPHRIFLGRPVTSSFGIVSVSTAADVPGAFVPHVTCSSHFLGIV